jgi:hypothetical protein
MKKQNKNAATTYKDDIKPVLNKNQNLFCLESTAKG